MKVEVDVLVSLSLTVIMVSVDFCGLCGLVWSLWTDMDSVDIYGLCGLIWSLWTESYFELELVLDRNEV